MSKILFAQDTSVYDASVYTIGENQLRLVFADAKDRPADEILYSGFDIINEYNPSIIEADYKDYKYKYRDTEDERVAEVDNNNVPWQPEPEPPVPPAPPVPEPKLVDVLNNKIAEFSNACRMNIENGIDLYIGGNVEHFSYYLGSGDQNNIDDLFNTMIQTLSGQFYHCDGGICKLYTAAQIFYIYFGNKANTQDNVTYYNLMSAQLHEKYDNAEDTAENRAEVEALVYKQAQLEGSFLSTYEAATTQALEQLEAYKGKLIEEGVDFSEHIWPVVVD